MVYARVYYDRGSITLPALPVGSKVQLNFEVAGYAHPSRGSYDLTQIENGFLFGEEGIPLGASIEGVVVASDTGKAIGPFSLSWRNASVKCTDNVLLLAYKELNRRKILAKVINCDRRQALLRSLVESISRVKDAFAAPI